MFDLRTRASRSAFNKEVTRLAQERFGITPALVELAAARESHLRNMRSWPEDLSPLWASILWDAGIVHHACNLGACTHGCEPGCMEDVDWFAERFPRTVTA